MTSVMTGQNSSELRTDFLEEYRSEESIRRYTRQTAGYGISYLLDHDYGNIYLDCIEKYIPKSRRKSGVRLWEFGCGGGMNLLHLVSVLERKGIRVDLACGTDFSDTLIEAASSEAKMYLPQRQLEKVRFAVASNENLVSEGEKGLQISKGKLLGSFDLVFGINTIRYGHRLNTVDQCVDNVYELLREGGLCIIIDMNSKFPAFRSHLRAPLGQNKGKATFLPALDQYADPFALAGFEILEKKNFCW